MLYGTSFLGCRIIIPTRWYKRVLKGLIIGVGRRVCIYVVYLVVNAGEEGAEVNQLLLG